MPWKDKKRHYEYEKIWAKRNPEKSQSLKRKANRRIHGVLNPTGEKKEGACKICGKITKLVYDHDHTTGLFRDWICGMCNRGLGHFNDSIELIEMALNYLKQHKPFGELSDKKK